MLRTGGDSTPAADTSYSAVCIDSERITENMTVMHFVKLQNERPEAYGPSLELSLAYSYEVEREQIER